MRVHLKIRGDLTHCISQFFTICSNANRPRQANRLVSLQTYNFFNRTTTTKNGASILWPVIKQPSKWREHSRCKKKPSSISSCLTLLFFRAPVISLRSLEQNKSIAKPLICVNYNDNYEILFLDFPFSFNLAGKGQEDISDTRDCVISHC